MNQFGYNFYYFINIYTRFDILFKKMCIFAPVRV